MSGAVDLQSARAVVTGASGFIGTHLVGELAARGADVVGIDRRAPSRFAPGDHRRLELTDPAAHEELAHELERADVVFHLAGRAGVRDCGPDVDSARRRDNGLAAAAVLGLTPATTPLLVTSSSSVYGGAPLQHGEPVPSRETDPLHPRGGYARSKVLVERLCARRRARGGLVTVVRPFTVVGPGQRPDMAVSRWLAAALEGRPAHVLGSLERRRDMTDVRQVARALADLSAHPEVDVVNVGTGRAVRLGEVLAAVVGAVERPVEIVVEPAPHEEPPVTCADTGRPRAVLGWSPRTDLDDLVRAQVAAGADLHSRVVSANMG